MKKIISVLLVCMVLLTCASVFADDTMYVFTPKSITVTYNGEPINFPDAQPIMQNSRTLTPVRAIMERARLTVDYNGETKTITASRDDLTVTMTLDNPEAIVTHGDESRIVTMDVPPTLIDNRTYVPIRFLSESIDMVVHWNGIYNEVVLIDTAAWKQEIAANAKLLNVLLDMPFAGEDAYAGNFSGLLQLGYILKNLPSETALAPQTTACLDFNAAGTNVYDGENFAAFVALDADVSALKTLYAAKGNADSAPADDIAAKHKIDLDMIVDNQWNLYVKSAGLLSLMEKAGQKAQAEAIGNRYIKIPLGDVLETKMPKMSDCSTYWDFFVASIKTDEMLYTQSVALLDDMIDVYIKKFHNDSLKITERYNGTFLWSLTVSQENITEFALQMSRLSGINAGNPVSTEALAQQKASLDNTTIKRTITVLMENDAPVKVEIMDASETNAEPIDYAGTLQAAKMPTVQKTNKANFGASTRKFNSYKDNKVIIPTNVISLEELKQIK